MIAFIDDQRGMYRLGLRSRARPICRLPSIAPSTCFAAAACRADPAKAPARGRRDVGLPVEIRRVFEEKYRVYGVRKV